MFFDEIEKKGSATSWAKHPSAGWYDWKSAKFWLVKNEKWKASKEKIEDGCFRVWDREAQTEKTFSLKEMPKEFVVISESWNVKGYLQTKGWVWWPEIYDFNEPLTVLAWNEVLYKGLWKDIKPDVNAVGLKLHRNLHCFDVENPNEIFTICLKGSASWEWWNTFQDDNAFAFLGKRISFGDEKELSTGSTDYSVPTFKIGKEMTDADREKRNEHMKTLKEFHEAASKQATTESSEISVADAIKENNESKYDEDNLPF